LISYATFELVDLMCGSSYPENFNFAGITKCKYKSEYEKNASHVSDFYQFKECSYQECTVIETTKTVSSVSNR
jgi:hypothetical protein